MTPAERARLIDQQEFEAECRAARERALQHAAQRQLEARRKTAAYLNEPMPAKPQHVFHLQGTAKNNKQGGRPPVFHPALGMEKTFVEWAAYAGVTPNGLRNRLHAGMTLEQAVSLPVEPRTYAALHTINGRSKTLQQWADHIGISYVALLKRMRSRTLAEAIAVGGKMSRWQRNRGVVSNLRPSVGTGGGSVACEFSEKDFHK